MREARGTGRVGLTERGRVRGEQGAEVGMEAGVCQGLGGVARWRGVESI